MNKCKWMVLVVGLAMMATTGGYLVRIHRNMSLGAPGVRVGPGLLYDELGQVAAKQCVLLPESVLGLKGTNLPVTRGELDMLPKDTTFGRKLYRDTNQLSVQTSVVLMGSDRTSIHQPQYCLTAQDWHIAKTERVLLPMDHPTAYKVPALKLTTSRTYINEFQQPVQMQGIYVYWFVSADQITSDQGQRMWSIARTMVEKGVLERWAYVSYFTTCLPGEEEATFEQLVKFIRASAPEFQAIAGLPDARRSPVAAR